MTIKDYKLGEKEQNEKKISEAIEELRKSPDKKLTIIEISNITKLTRQTIAQYDWVKDELKKIKDERLKNDEIQHNRKIREFNELERLKADLKTAKESIAKSSLGYLKAVEDLESYKRTNKEQISVIDKLNLEIKGLKYELSKYSESEVQNDNLIHFKSKG